MMKSLSIRTKLGARQEAKVTGSRHYSPEVASQAQAKHASPSSSMSAHCYAEQLATITNEKSKWRKNE